MIDWSGYAAGETVTADQRGYPNRAKYGNPRMCLVARFRGSRAWRILHRTPCMSVMSASAERFRAWRYANLGDYSADHFLSERFRDRRSMVVLGRTESATIIGFCPQDDSQADLQGELQIGVNASLMSARWSFRVPHDDDDAGGEAMFVPTVYDGREYILAISGAFWRSIGKNLYDQRRFARVQWGIAQTQLSCRYAIVTHIRIAVIVTASTQRTGTCP